MKQLRHLGVYGIALKEECLCCVVKGPNAGPYANRYDLPGGSLQPGETLIEALHRECLEELGTSVRITSQAYIHDMVVSEALLQQQTHHIAVFYEIECNQVKRMPLAHQVLDGENDAVDVVWVPLKSLTAENSSPLVQFVSNYYLGGQWSVEASRFPDWQRQVIKK